MATVRFGAAGLADFTWKQLLDLDALHPLRALPGQLPSVVERKPLSPKFVILDLQRHMNATAAAVLRGGEPDGVSMIGDIISEDVLWSCTTCRACEEHCPVGIEHVDTIVDMRRNLVLEQGQMPETAEAALRSLEQRGHPWRGTQETRTTWTEGLDIPFIADHPDAEYLFWVAAPAPSLNATCRSPAPWQRYSSEPGSVSLFLVRTKHARATRRAAWETSTSSSCWRSRTSPPCRRTRAQDRHSLPALL